MTVDTTDVRPNMRPNGNSFAEGTLDPPVELRAPPLAPKETTATGHVLLRVETIRPVIGGEDLFQPSEPNNPSETFGPRRKLIAGPAIIATLGLAGLTYFFFASTGAKVPAGSVPIAVQSSSEVPVQAAVNVPESSSLTSVESSSEAPVQPATTAPESSRGEVYGSFARCSHSAHGRGFAPSCSRSGSRLFTASGRKHQVCALRKRAHSWDRPQGHAIHSYKPGGGLGRGREHPLEGLDQFPISRA